jgi:hypothetical protein
MKQRNSEIFNEFAKIAIKDGLITEAEEKETTNSNKDYDDMIQMLYGIKPNGDEKHIMEQAHPESPVIIAPSYDRLNGLVENPLERQNVMVGIARRPTHGHLTQHRYASAHQGLTEELVRIGFTMDNKDQDELRILADSCSQRIVKEAFWPAVGMWALRLAPKALGLYLTYAGIKNVLDYEVSQGLFNDGVNAIKSLRKAALVAQKPSDKNALDAAANSAYSLMKKLVSIKQILVPQSGVLDIFEDTSIRDSLMAAQQFSGDSGAIIKSYLEELPQAVSNLNIAARILETEEPTGSTLPGFLGEISTLYHKITGNEFEEAKAYVKTFLESLKQASAKMGAVHGAAQQKAEEHSAELKNQEEKKKLNSEESGLELEDPLLWAE